jgi:hypothetical protein
MRLHKKVHSAHEQFFFTDYHFMDTKYQSVYVENDKLKLIYKALFDVLVFFYFFLLTCFPELKKSLLSNSVFYAIH